MNKYTRNFINSLELSNTKNIAKIKPKYFNTKHKTIIFNTGMGSGKTTTTLQYLKEHSKESFIWLSPRQTLCLNTYNRMQDEFNINCVSHLKVGPNKKKLSEANNLLICNQSLHHLDITKQYDTVVIDEIETVLIGWTPNATYGKFIKECFDTFKRILIHAKKIILLDAFTTKKTINFLHSIGINDDQIIIYTSKYKPPQKIIILEENITCMIQDISRVLDEGNRCFIFYAFKGSSEKRYSIEEFDVAIKESCKNKNIKSLIYHSSSKAKSNLDNVNDQWSEVNYVLSTSCITVGVNYDRKDYHSIFMLVSGYSNNARDLIQSSMRIRSVENPIMKIHFFDRENTKLVELNNLYHNDNIYKSLIDDNTNEILADFTESFYALCKLTNYEVDKVLLDAYKAVKGKTNTMFVSKTLFEYTQIPTVSDFEIVNLENKCVNGKGSEIENEMVSKYYFNCYFMCMNSKDRACVWNTNSRAFFEMYDNLVVKQLIKDNNVDFVCDINYNNVIISDELKNLLNRNISYRGRNIDNRILVNYLNICCLKFNGINRKKTKSGIQYYDNSERMYDLQNIYNRFEHGKKLYNENLQYLIKTYKDQELAYLIEYNNAFLKHASQLTDDDFEWYYDENGLDDGLDSPILFRVKPEKKFVFKCSEKFINIPNSKKLLKV